MLDSSLHNVCSVFMF